MLADLFKGIFDSSFVTVISVPQFLLCIGVALAAGCIIVLTAGRGRSFSHSFLIALAGLPALVCATIMMVNGNIGAGVATAGAFSLVRFRSAAGSAREIALIFLSMVVGLIAGMGYLAYAVLFALVLGVAFMVANFFDPEARGLQKELRVVIPEDLDYTGVFDETLRKYCKKWKLVRVKTVNMGSLFRLRYIVTMRKGVSEKEFIDDLRLRNGNLEISLAEAEMNASDL
ncbi:MAG: DUF4956 domain-containing protein [Clostridia bacterium]|nr:DUF4956 domain-containing protein [Clostridia bacterium]